MISNRSMAVAANIVTRQQLTLGEKLLELALVGEAGKRKLKCSYRRHVLAADIQ